VQVGTKVGVAVCLAVWCGSMILPGPLWWHGRQWFFGYHLAQASLDDLRAGRDVWLLAGLANVAMAAGWILIPVAPRVARWVLSAGGLLALWPVLLLGLWLEPVYSVAWTGSCLLAARVLWLEGERNTVTGRVT
jgi:hypothetical protein